MKKTMIDARGEACPIPVVKANRGLQGMTEPGILELHVDNDIAVQNLMHMASGHKLKSTAEKVDETHFIVSMTVMEPIEQVSSTEIEEQDCCFIGAKGEYVVAIASPFMGAGDDELGQILIKGFFFALSQLPQLPKTIIFYNGGAKLTAKGSECLDDLQNMEAQGVEIITCGTCLNFYNLTDQLAVGNASNMYTIVETLCGAQKVVRP
ncbi:MAG: sulfurtransferase-like selenium metabolism protein YedF [Peptostreptococcaceae bacterium]|nr:sulfurtransferase-like selenium metabolism protein YedF [Peptostreptococcaceae bacterium]